MAALVWLCWTPRALVGKIREFQRYPLPQNIEIERRLAAVLAADVAGFSRLTEADEVGTMRLLAAQRAILDAAIARHRGRIANTAGDSVLAEFPSAVNAVQCAVEVQQALRDAAEGAAEDRRVLFRIGIHVGDVMARGGDLLGTGVNVAARLEALADAGGIVISAAAHEQVKKILPLAYTDLGSQQVKNIEEPVRAFAIGSAPVAIAAFVPGDGKPLSLPDKPSIAVLPFQNMSGDPEQDYFADGMVEDIITALSRFKSLFVIARNSSFTYKGNAVDIKQVGRELGVRYVLEGSIRKAASKVRITGQLIEVASSSHLWADNFDGALQDVFDLQDRVTRSVVGAIFPRLDRASLEAPLRKPLTSWGSYDHYLRGRMLLYERTNAWLDNAQGHFQEAIMLDPTSGPAHAWLALCTYFRLNVMFLPISDEERGEALRLAQRATELASDDAAVLVTSFYVIWNLTDEFERAAELANRAVALNPNSSGAWAIKGWSGVFLAEPPEGLLDALDRSIRLNPLDPERVLVALRGKSAVCVFAGRFEEGAAFASQALALRPNDIQSLILLESNSFEGGNLEVAANAAARIRSARPMLRKINLLRIVRRTRIPAQLVIIDRQIARLDLPE